MSSKSSKAYTLCMIFLSWNSLLIKEKESFSKAKANDNPEYIIKLYEGGKGIL